MNAHDKGIHTFEIEKDASVPCINVGRFTFALSAFDIAGKWTKEQLNSESIRTIIIDEIGKLEMNDQGFHDLFVFVLNHIYTKHLIIVVRDFLLDDFIKKYALKDYEIKNTLDALWSRHLKRKIQGWAIIGCPDKPSILWFLRAQLTYNQVYLMYE